MEKHDYNLYQMNIDQIQRYLPHRAPFLYVDKILEIHPHGDLNDLSAGNMVGIRVISQKNVTFNEAHFRGHFPGLAIVPGVLIIESMAQTASFSLYPYVLKNLEQFARHFQCVLVGVDGARFRKPVIPGDVMLITSVVTKCRGKLWMFKCEVTANQQTVAEASLLANLVSGKEVL